MKKILVSAPGKVILHGEHAVVYGKAAVAGSLNLRTYLLLTRRDDDILTLSLPDINMEKSWSLEFLTSKVRSSKVDLYNPEPAANEQIQTLKSISSENNNTTQALAAISFLYLYYTVAETIPRPLPAIDVCVRSELPIGAGLGSSASYSVCLASSLLYLAGHVTPKYDQSGNLTWLHNDLELINKWAFLSEKIIHGTPSGIDNAVATFGSAIKFKKGDISPLSKMPRLKILVVNTQVERSTKQLVSNVRQKYDKFPDIFKPLMESVDALVTRCCEEYSKMADNEEDESLHESYSVLEEMIRTNHCLMQTLGVSHPKLEFICSLAKEHHLSAKLTGAGGGGCAYCLLKQDTDDSLVKNLVTKLKVEGFECWETSVGGVGVVYHDNKTDDKHFNIPSEFMIVD